MLREAQLQAAEILQEAAVRAERAQEEAWAQGLEAGRQEGLATAEQEMVPLRLETDAARATAQDQANLVHQAAEAQARALLADAEARVQGMLLRAREEAAEILREARSDQARRLDESRTALMDLAVTAAVRLVQGHLALQPAAIVNMVAAGLRRLKDTECSVRVNLHDLPLLEAQRSVLERELGAGLLRIQPDAGLSQGSYIVNSTHGMIDARLEVQEEAIRSALGAALGGAPT